MAKSLIQILIENKVITNADVEKYYNENIRQQACETSNKKIYSKIKNGVLVEFDKRDLVDGKYVVPECVTKIGRYSINSCKELKKVVISKNVEVIEPFAFIGSKMQTIFIPKNVKNIGSEAFAYCKDLESVYIEDGGEVEIGTKAFMDCSNLRRVKLGEGIKKLSKWTFNKCDMLYEVDIPNSLIHICSRAFECCPSIEQIKLPNGLQRISEYAFAHCTGLKEIDMPESVTLLGPGVFYGCTSLEKVKLSHNLEYVDMFTFDGCVNLSKIYIPKTLTYIDINAFAKCPAEESALKQVEENKKMIEQEKGHIK